MTNQEKEDYFLLINRWFPHVPIVLSTNCAASRKELMTEEEDNLEVDREEKLKRE